MNASVKRLFAAVLSASAILLLPACGNSSAGSSAGSAAASASSAAASSATANVNSLISPTVLQDADGLTLTMQSLTATTDGYTAVLTCKNAGKTQITVSGTIAMNGQDTGAAFSTTVEAGKTDDQEIAISTATLKDVTTVSDMGVFYQISDPSTGSGSEATVTIPVVKSNG